MGNNWLTIIEASKILHCHEITLRKLARDKKIKAYKVLGQYLINKQDLDNFIMSNCNKE